MLAPHLPQKVTATWLALVIQIQSVVLVAGYPTTPGLAQTYTNGGGQQAMMPVHMNSLSEELSFLSLLNRPSRARLLSLKNLEQELPTPPVPTNLTWQRSTTSQLLGDLCVSKQIFSALLV